MKCCDYICDLDVDKQRKIFVHLKEEIETLKGLLPIVNEYETSKHLFIS